MTNLPVAAGILCGLIVMALLFRPFFGGKKDFWECVGYSLTPNFLSWLGKDLQRDYGKSAKLAFFIFIGAACGLLAYIVANNLMGGN